MYYIIYNVFVNIFHYINHIKKKPDKCRACLHNAGLVAGGWWLVSVDFTGLVIVTLGVGKTFLLFHAAIAPGTPANRLTALVDHKRLRSNRLTSCDGLALSGEKVIAFRFRLHSLLFFSAIAPDACAGLSSPAYTGHLYFCRNNRRGSDLRLHCDALTLAVGAHPAACHATDQGAEDDRLATMVVSQASERTACERPNCGTVGQPIAVRHAVLVIPLRLDVLRLADVRRVVDLLLHDTAVCSTECGRSLRNITTALTVPDPRGTRLVDRHALRERSCRHRQEEGDHDGLEQILHEISPRKVGKGRVLFLLRRTQGQSIEVVYSIH